MVIHASVVCYAISSPVRSGDVRTLLSEHHHPIYRDSPNIGAVSGGRAISGSVVEIKMVVTKRSRLG